MKYTGKLLHDMGKNHPLILRFLAECWATDNKEIAHLIRKAGRVYKYRSSWGKKFARESNRNGGREFLGAFFIHWLAAYRHKNCGWTVAQSIEFQRKEGALPP